MNFSLNRFQSLIKRDWIYYKKPVSYGLAALVIILGIFFYVNYRSNEHNMVTNEFYMGWYVSLLFAAGALLCTSLFWEFKTAHGRLQFLSLPASHLEKLLSRGFYMMVVYPLILTLLMFVLYSIGRMTGISDPLGDEALEIWSYLIRFYWIGVSLLMIFSVTFNRYTPPKTIVTGMLIYFLFVLIAVLIFRVVYYEVFDGFWKIDPTVHLEPDEEKIESLFKSLRPIAEILLWIGLPVYLWVIAYFKMKEKEA